MPTIDRAKAACAALLCLLASACFLLPGKFASELSLRRDGSFAFSYKGDVHVLALTKMAQDDIDGDAEFKPLPQCKDEGSGGEACSDEDEATQRSNWVLQQEAAKAKKKQDAEIMQKMLGGIDPADPRAAEELAERMRKQAGWKSVQYLGDGKFAVDFAIAGRLDHDFSFPTVEKLPVATPFVSIYRRADGSVRVDAPAFAAVSNGGPFAGMAQAMAGWKDEDDAKASGVPQLDGSFAIVTDGEILANNTDEGPQAGTTGKRLSWKVTPRTTSAPTALIRLRP